MKKLESPMVVFHLLQAKGLIKLTENINLTSVLHVPNLACNLLSVSKLCKDSNYRVTFFDSHCAFQDQTLGTMIGCVRMIEGLYYFDDISVGNKKVQGFSSTSSIPVPDTIMLWHLRLAILVLPI